MLPFCDLVVHLWRRVNHLIYHWLFNHHIYHFQVFYQIKSCAFCACAPMCVCICEWRNCRQTIDECKRLSFLFFSSSKQTFLYLKKSIKMFSNKMQIFRLVSVKLWYCDHHFYSPVCLKKSLWDFAVFRCKFHIFFLHFFLTVLRDCGFCICI